MFAPNRSDAPLDGKDLCPRFGLLEMINQVMVPEMPYLRSGLMVESISKIYRDTKFAPTLLKQVRRDIERLIETKQELGLYNASIEINNTHYPTLFTGVF